MKLLTQEIRNRLPRIRGQEALGDDAVVYCKFFTPWTGWTWYVTEGGPILDEQGNETDFEFYGLVDGHCQELGYFVLSELERIRGPGGLTIERDLYWYPVPLRQIRQATDGHPLDPVIEVGESFEVEAEGGEKVTLLVQATDKRADLLKYGRWLEAAWCTCKKSEFLCYPEDGQCPCGVYKHHVHCKTCGGVSQVG